MVEHAKVQVQDAATRLFNLVKAKHPENIEVEDDVEIAKVEVTVDGTWQKRGHSTKMRVPYTFFVKRDRGYFFLVKRDLSFYLFVIRDRPSPDHFYVHVKAVLELSVTHGRTFELNVIRELNCFV